MAAQASAFAQNLSNLRRYLKRAKFVLLPNRFGSTGILRARFNDAVFLSEANRYLFASNEKVANTTLRSTFQLLEGGGQLPPLYKPYKRWTGPLLQPSDAADFEASLTDPGIRKFCVVRNPYARLISCFRNKLTNVEAKGYRRKMRELGLDPRGKISFDEFIRAVARQDQKLMNSHWRIQYYNVFMDIIRYDEVILYENFPERLPGLVAELYPARKDAAEAIVSRNRQSRNSDALVEQYFTPALRDIVRDVYRLDFETFGYPP